jgi:hypothetical protein
MQQLSTDIKGLYMFKFEKKANGTEQQNNQELVNHHIFKYLEI